MAVNRLKRCGFTLVELLVVIGIIALLISILLPAMNKAREAGKKAVCLSNLHQAHIALTLYANAYRGRTLVGHSSSQYQQNYTVWSKGSPEPQELGLLYRAKLTSTGGREFYCPSNFDPQHAFDDPTNITMDKQDKLNSNPATLTTVNTRIGYSKRPGVSWDGVKLKVTTPAQLWPVLYDYRNKAILADVNSSLIRIAERHKKGINVLYGNGAAKWVPLEVFKKQLEPSSDTFSSSNNPYQDATWQALDKY